MRLSLLFFVGTAGWAAALSTERTSLQPDVVITQSHVGEPLPGKGQPIVDPPKRWNGKRIVCISHGTTGTHSIFYAARELRLPAVHYRAQHRAEDTPPPGSDGEYPDGKGWEGENHAVFPFHYPLLQMQIDLQFCHGPDLNETQCHFGREWVAVAERHVAEAAWARVSLFDTPYPYFPRALASAAFIDNKTAFVHLPRDANDWASSRGEGHESAVICHRDLWASDAKSGGALTFSPLDLPECASRCEAAGRASTQCLQGVTEMPTALVARAFAANEALLVDLFASRASYLLIDLFNSTQDMETEEIVARIVSTG